MLLVLGSMFYVLGVATAMFNNDYDSTICASERRVYKYNYPMLLGCNVAKFLKKEFL
jgi:hypothetical protein